MASVVVITAPAVLPLSNSEVKQHLRIDHADDDTYIATLIAAAVQHIDGPDGWLGRSLINRTLELRRDFYCGPDITLPYPPIVSVSSVKYDDSNGAEQTLSSSAYRLVGFPSSPRLSLAYGQSWPATRWQSEAVRVRYIAGYGAAGSAVPAPIRHALLLLIGHMYERREAASAEKVEALPFAVDALLSPFRIYA